MRSIPIRLLLSAAVVATFAVAAAGANASSSTATVVAPMKLCTYATGDPSEGSQTLIVKMVATGGGGVRGTMRVTSTGLDKTVPFRLKKGGIGQVAIPVTPPMALTLTTKLILKPANPTRTDHVTITAADPNAPAPRGCVAR
jgi:hypothetical protein